MEKKIIGIFGSFPSLELLLISLKLVSEYFELSVHMLFSGESYTWCNSVYFEVAQHLLLQERIRMLRIQLFSPCSLERGWTTEPVGVVFFKVGSRFELAEVLCCLRGVQLRGASWLMATEQLCSLIDTLLILNVWTFAKEMWREKQKGFVTIHVFGSSPWVIVKSVDCDLLAYLNGNTCFSIRLFHEGLQYSRRGLKNTGSYDWEKSVFWGSSRWMEFHNFHYFLLWKT